MKNFWNEKYGQPEYAYGEQPNEYFKKQLDKLPAGTILLPAEGEGRNAVYAASKGWKVFAFDQSIEGKKKADLLAKKNNVQINYEVGELQDIKYAPGQFDMIALIYAHFSSDKRAAYHKKLSSYLKVGGMIILEAFSKQQLEYSKLNEKAGGPKDIDMLYSKEEIKSDFDSFQVIELIEKETELNEGFYHVGKSSVIRFTGIKK